MTTCESAEGCADESAYHIQQLLGSKFEKSLCLRHFIQLCAALLNAYNKHQGRDAAS